MKTEVQLQGKLVELEYQKQHIEDDLKMADNITDIGILKTEILVNDNLIDFINWILNDETASK